MWMVLPVGHDQGVRRFPWVTVTIMAVSLAVQIHRSFFGCTESDVLAIAEARADIEQEVMLEYRKIEMAKLVADVQGSAEHIEEKMKAMQQGTDGMLAAFRSGELTGPDDPRYVKWLGIKEREASLRRKDLAELMAFRPANTLCLGLFTSAFVHGGWLHLIGNMLFLYLVGCNLEDRWGRGVFAGLFLAGSAVSALAFAHWHPNGESALIGASGAVAAGMGAFLVCFHQAQIKLLLITLYRAPAIIEVYAFWALPAWFLSQLLHSWFEAHGIGGVAYSAHVGGFAFGLVTAVSFKVFKIESRYLLPATAKGVEWQEDPEFLKALDIAQTDNQATALPLLQALVKRNPRHEGAWRQIALISFQSGDTARGAAAIDQFVGCLPRARLPEGLALVRETHSLDVSTTLTDRTLSTLVRGAVIENDSRLAVAVARRLMKEFPESPYTPGVLWEMATLQENARRPDLVTATLHQIIARFPQDPFATKARAKLNLGSDTPAPILAAPSRPH